jgi:hypothetical protein
VLKEEKLFVHGEDFDVILALDLVEGRLLWAQLVDQVLPIEGERGL